MTWLDSPRVTALRRRSWLIDLTVETLSGWKRHLSSRNAAVLAYYGFLATFPLIMIATAVLNIVLRNDDELRERLIDSALSELPVIGNQIRTQTGTLSGDVIAVITGGVIALWAATRTFTAVQLAYDDIWEIPVLDRSNSAIMRLKALAGILIIGSSLIITGTLSSYGWNGLREMLSILGVLAVNFTVLSLTMRFFPSRSPTFEMVWPGALTAALGFAVLQIAGTAIVRHYVASASDVAGVFATVFALMAWLNLHAMVALAGAEINSARARRRAGIEAVDIVVLGRARHRPENTAIGHHERAVD